MSSRASSSTSEYTTAKVLAWARGLETFERMDFVYLLMHSLFPTELRYIHGIIDGLLKRDESLYSGSVNQANDFARLSHFYENYDPRTVMANDGLRRQFIVDLSSLHPLNFYCADIFFGVLQRAELGTWSFAAAESQKLLRELILITTMVARHAAFRFDNRLFIWNISRMLTLKLKALKEAEEQEEISRQDTEDELDQPKVDVIPLVVDREPVEHQATVTASGAERLPNGYYEVPHQIQNVAHENNKRPQKQSGNMNANFPPLNSSLQQSTAQFPVSPGGMVNHRPKAPSVPARMNENLTTGRSPSEVASYPAYHQKRTPEQNSIPRSNSVENCDFRQRPEPAQAEERSGFLQGGRGMAQRSISSSIEFPRLSSENVISATPPVAPHLATPLARLLPENHLRNDVEPLAVRRNPAESEEIIHMVPGPPEQWPIPLPASRPVNNAPGITGAFPRIYSITGPNGPRLSNHVPYMVPVNANFAGQPVFQRPASCFNCGCSGHVGQYCPKKKLLEKEQAEKYCSLQRDAKLYPEKGRPSSRLPGPHHS